MKVVTRISAMLARNLERFTRHVVIGEIAAWATPCVRWLRQPLGVLALTALAALLCGLFVAPQGFVVFASVVAVMTVGCIWPWVGIRGVTCDLSFAATRTEEGKPVEAQLTITNRWPWPVWGLAVEGGLSRDGSAESRAAIAVSRVAGWSRGHYRWSFTPTMRGRYPIASPQLVTEFPFGLWKARKPVRVASDVIAWPRRFALPPLPMHFGRHSWVGQPTELAAGSLGHRTTAREYRQGDSMRQIHWAKTALYDRLVAYEREGFAISDATITLDTHSSLHPEDGPDSTLEWSIRIAASVGDALVRQGVGVTLVSHVGRFRLEATGSSPSGMLDWLALLDGSENGSIKPRTRSCSTALTIHITTDLSGATAGDSIVLRTGPQRASVASRTAAGGWISVGPEGDIPLQIRKGWRNGPKRLRYAC
ncbi:MAG: DUF58 domain-containing protein [Planctomycetota bacterium]|nr:MAG: DUF58 domain-containing protein [Planctomycetota bacterium]